MTSYTLESIYLINCVSLTIRSASGFTNRVIQLVFFCGLWSGFSTRRAFPTSPHIWTRLSTSSALKVVYFVSMDYIKHQVQEDKYCVTVIFRLPFDSSDVVSSGKTQSCNLPSSLLLPKHVVVGPISSYCEST